MRYMLRNVVRDMRPDIKARRDRNPSKVCRRPYFNGKPLPPNSNRMLRIHDFTPELFDQIRDHIEWGNVQLLAVGRGGGEVDMEALGKQLGYFELAQAEVIPIEEQDPTKPPLEPGMTVEGTPLEEEPVMIADETTTEPDGTPIPEGTPIFEADPDEDSEEEWEDVDEDEPYTEAELMALKKDDLIEIHKNVTDEPYGGKTKQELADDILAAQAGE